MINRGLINLIKDLYKDLRLFKLTQQLTVPKPYFGLGFHDTRSIFFSCGLYLLRRVFPKVK